MPGRPPGKSLDAYLAVVPQPARAALAELCRIVVSSDGRVRGEVKGNAPSFTIDEHFATAGVLGAGGVRLVLHTGAKRRGVKRAPVIGDPEKLLDWKDTDRALVVFADVDDVRRNEAAMRAILREWIDQTQSAES